MTILLVFSLDINLRNISFVSPSPRLVHLATALNQSSRLFRLTHDAAETDHPNCHFLSPAPRLAYSISLPTPPKLLSPANAAKTYQPNKRLASPCLSCLRLALFVSPSPCLATLYRRRLNLSARRPFTKALFVLPRPVFFISPTT